MCIVLCCSGIEKKRIRNLSNVSIDVIDLGFFVVLFVC